VFGEKSESKNYIPKRTTSLRDVVKNQAPLEF
jgi:hypothetical protein